MNLFRRAAAGEAGGADRARMLYDLGDAQMWAGAPASAVDAFDEAGRLAAVVGDRSLGLLAGICRSAAMMLTEPHAKPTDVFRSELEEAVHVFEQAGDDAALSTVWTELAGIEWMPCRYDRAAIAAGRAIDHARRSGDERLLAGALLIRIIAAVHGSTSPEDGIRLLDDLGPELSRSRQMEAITLVARAFHQGLRGSSPEARRMFADSIEVSRSLGLRFDLAAAHEALGHLERYAGDLTASERAFRENYDLLDELGDEGHKSTAAANLALALSYLERFDEAEPYADIAVRVAAEDDLASQAPGRSARALVLASRGELDEADRLAREAVDLYLHAKAEAPSTQAGTCMDLARVQRTAGEFEDAARSAREALALYERKGNRPGAAFTRAFIEELRSDGSSHPSS